MDDLERQRLKQARDELNAQSQGFRARLAGRVGWPLDDMPSLYFDRAGKPIGLGDWSYLHHDPGYCILAKVWPDEWTEVSTVWIGMDMSHGFGAPLIFETMIFGGPLDGYQRRYHDEAAALVGHMVAFAHAQSVPFWRKLWWIVTNEVKTGQDEYMRAHVYRWDAPKLAPLWSVGS